MLASIYGTVKVLEFTSADWYLASPQPLKLIILPMASYLGSCRLKNSPHRYSAAGSSDHHKYIIIIHGGQPLMLDLSEATGPESYMHAVTARLWEPCTGCAVHGHAHHVRTVLLRHGIGCPKFYAAAHAISWHTSPGSKWKTAAAPVACKTTTNTELRHS